MSARSESLSQPSSPINTRHISPELLRQLREDPTQTQKKDIDQSLLPSEETLRRFAILTPGQRHISTRRIFDSGKASENWIYGYEILAEDSEGEPIRKTIRELSNISMGMDVAGKTKHYVQKTQHLASLGIPTLYTYGADKATIYQEFIENDLTKPAFALIKRQPESDAGDALLDQLVDIAARLDEGGYSESLDFLNDLLFDGDRAIFIYIDPGVDLGQPSNNETKHSLLSLNKRFKDIQDLITPKYLATRERIRT